MGLYHYWLVMIVLVVELCFDTSNSQHLTCHPSDQEALRELSPYQYQYGWGTNFSKNCCDWEGITCNSSSSLGLNDPNNTARVTKLELTNFAFWRGRLSESLGRLHQIRVLNLSNNHISDSIPTSIFNLINLEILDLSSNWLYDTLSPALGNLSSLVHLDLSVNQFSGEIPDVFSKLSKLKILLANDNEFTGGIPKSLANSQSLVLLNLRSNSLSGDLRLNCNLMTNLTYLDLESNQLNGSLPQNLPSCRNLRNTSLAGNLFFGQVPESFRDVNSLLSLSLTKANIPAALQTLQHCKNLTTLILSNSNIHEEMLLDQSSLHFEKLKVLIVQNCWLTGPLPSWLSRSTNLHVLDLSWNRFTGAIPDWIGGLTNLLYLDLSRNSLTGEIPKSLTTLQSLSSRDVSFNETSLVFPFLYRRNEIEGTEFLPMSMLDLSHNGLSGPIWKEFGNLKKLHFFDISFNRLRGSIPTELSGMTSLEIFDMSNNGISGSIPVSLKKLKFLSSFNVANNNLSGIIPSGFRFSTFSFVIGNHFSCTHNCLSGFLYNKPSGTSDSDSDYFLDSNGLAVGYCLALVVVAALTWSFFPFPGK